MTAANLRQFWQRATFADPKADLAFEWKGLLRFLPLLLCGGFFGFSILWLALGPLDWHISNSGLLYTFLIAAVLALTSGYVFGAIGSRRLARFAESDRTSPTKLQITPNTALIVSGLAGLVLYFPTAFATTGHWVPDVIAGLTNPGAAYRVTKELNASGSPLIHYVRFVTSPLLILAAPITYFLWPRLSWLARSLGVLSIAGVVALSIAQGINKGMADLTAYSCLFFALVALSSIRKGRRKRFFGAVLGSALVIALFLSYYAVSIQSRIAGDVARAESAEQTPTPPSSTETPLPTPPSSDPSEPNSSVSDEQVADAIDSSVTLGIATQREGHFIYALPNNLKASTLVLSNYVTHAYRGLSMALTEEWTPTYGLGFSEFFRHNLTKIYGGPALEKSVESETYAGKISSDGWPVGQLWATFFVDPASDISFPGVIILLVFVGFTFGRSWRDTVTRGDPLAAAVFYCLCMLVFYLPANNQLFLGGETALGFTGVFAAWVLLRSRAVTRLGAKFPPGSRDDRLIKPTDQVDSGSISR